MDSFFSLSEVYLVSGETRMFCNLNVVLCKNECCPFFYRVSRSVTKGLLMHLGCYVTTVGSSDECMRTVSQEHKVVFMDVSMDCYELASHFRERFGKRHERPLVVALTGNTDKATKENCIRFGLDGVILKPVSVDKMRNVLAELLERRVLFEAM